MPVFFMLMEKMENLIAVSEIEKNLLKFLNPIFLDSEFEIIRVKVYGTENIIVQIMIDHIIKIIDIDDCAKYSRLISDVLDKENLISQNFNLEVSSPGINRPLTRLKDFHNCRGNKVRITEKNFEDKKINYKGILTEITENSILLDQEKNLVSIKLDKISDAKLLV